MKVFYILARCRMDTNKHHVRSIGFEEDHEGLLVLFGEEDCLFDVESGKHLKIKRKL